MTMIWPEWMIYSTDKQEDCIWNIWLEGIQITQWTERIQRPIQQNKDAYKFLEEFKIQVKREKYLKLSTLE